jgi:N-sulfoglucosamine sulfohydrolase
MMTGRYPQTNGMLGLAHDPWSWHMHDSERHISHVLRDAGYQTALIGHIHETMDPDELAFDHHSRYKCILPEGYEYYSHAAHVAEGVGDFIAHNREPDKPLYLQIGFFETHTPFGTGGAQPYTAQGVDLPEPVLDSPEARAHFAALQGALKNLDDAVGRILACLDTHGMRENTIVVFTTDHGVDIMPYQRFKHALYDRGIEIAHLIRYPKRIAAASSSQDLLSNVDVLPTLLELMDIDVPDNLEGASFAGVFDGQAVGRSEVFAEYTAQGHAMELRAIRTERYKLIRSFAAHNMQTAPVDFTKKPGDRAAPIVQLFDLQDDPYELRNLADEPHAEAIRTNLDGRLRAWMRAVNDPVLQGPVASPYYRAAIRDFVGGD